MGKPLATSGYNKKPQEYWDKLINVKAEGQVLPSEPVKTRPILFSHAEYDTLQPEEKIREFCAYIRQVAAQYEYDKNLLTTLESKMQDILHYIELTKNKDTVTGYKLYKELCDVRRQRRQCKSELELLNPVYEMFHGTTFLDLLANVQGSCKRAKQAIANKGYTVRTDALDEFLGD